MQTVNIMLAVVLILAMAYYVFDMVLKYVEEPKDTIIPLSDMENKITVGAKQPRVLTESEIEEIHSRGKITAMEKVREIEALDLCAPGDNIGSASHRCRTFKDCHACLMDYYADKDEYDSIETVLDTVMQDIRTI